MSSTNNIAAGGLTGLQTRLDVIANNIANINTPGYKGSRVEFKDLLYTGAGANPVFTGTGVTVSSTNRDFSDGPLQDTGRMWDVAIDGPGFFMLDDPQAGRLYTRSGSLFLSPEEGGTYLVTAKGQYLLDANGNRITVDPNADSGQAMEALNRLAVVRFPNEAGLLAMGDGTYAESAVSGGAQNVAEPELRQGMLEGSNVRLEEELTLLMRTQRAFSLASQSLRTADQMDGLANNMR